MGLLSNQKGFSALEVGFFVIVMGLMGGSGYYVVQQNKSDESQSEVAEQQVPADESEATSQTYVDTAKVYSIEVPSSWSAERDGSATEGEPRDWTQESQAVYITADDAPQEFGVGAQIIVLSKEIAEQYVKDSYSDGNHTIKEVTINGTTAHYDIVKFTGPNDSEKYRDDIYYVYGENKAVRITFRSYWHGKKSGWDDSKNRDEFKAMVQTLRLL